MRKTVSVGIDLGTDACRVALHDGEATRVVPTALGASEKGWTKYGPSSSASPAYIPVRNLYRSLDGRQRPQATEFLKAVDVVASIFARVLNKVQARAGDVTQTVVAVPASLRSDEREVLIRHAWPADGPPVQLVSSGLCAAIGWAREHSYQGPVATLGIGLGTSHLSHVEVGESDAVVTDARSNTWIGRNDVDDLLLAGIVHASLGDGQALGPYRAVPNMKAIASARERLTATGATQKVRLRSHSGGVRVEGSLSQADLKEAGHQVSERVTRALQGIIPRPAMPLPPGSSRAIDPSLVSLFSPGPLILFRHQGVLATGDVDLDRLAPQHEFVDVVDEGSVATGAAEAAWDISAARRRHVDVLASFIWLEVGFPEARLLGGVPISQPTTQLPFKSVHKVIPDIRKELKVTVRQGIHANLYRDPVVFQGEVRTVGGHNSEFDLVLEVDKSGLLTVSSADDRAIVARTQRNRRY